ncbi:MAG: hypothetical protein AAGA97_00955 [Pseudomonadota bacterium]
MAPSTVAEGVNSGLPTLTVSCRDCPRSETYILADLMTMCGPDKEEVVDLSAQCEHPSGEAHLCGFGFRWRDLLDGAVD